MLVKEWENEDGDLVGKLVIEWDGEHTVGISASPDLKNKVDGLCGKFAGGEDENIEYSASCVLMSILFYFIFPIYIYDTICFN